MKRIYKRKRYGRKVKSNFSKVLMIVNLTMYSASLLLIGLVFILYRGGYSNDFSDAYEYISSNLTDEDGYPQATMYFKDLRYLGSLINYSISGCKEISIDQINEGLDMLRDKTILEFVQTSSEDSQIAITCDLRPPKLIPISATLGEGGPEDIDVLENYIRINKARITLYRIDECPPHVFVHEMMHTFGFSHSENPESFMFGSIDCESQKFNEYFFTRLNEIYSEVV